MIADRKPIVIIGAGEQAAIAYEYFTDDSPDKVVAFSAERPFLTSSEHCGLPVVALDELPGRYPPTDYQAYVAASYTQLNRVRRRLYRTVKAAGYECAGYASSHAFVSRTAEVGDNCFIEENVAVQPGSRLGNNVFVSSGTCVGHSVLIEDDCFIGPGVILAGSCRVGRASFLGAQCCIKDDVAVAEDCVVGAGAVVLKDTTERGVYVGNPARATSKDSFATLGVTSDA
jgi:sugar O-acyltransferase (sialic acid O-acetyltransferase NeuD family)